MAKEFDRGIIPNSDIIMSGYQEYIPLPNTGDNLDDPNPWLPKTDWSRDGIIANGQE